MTRLITKSKKKPGLPPGTLIHVGEKKSDDAKITLIDYGQKHCQAQEIESIEDVVPYCDKPSVTWLNIDGLHRVDILEQIGGYFKVHPLVLEDILNTTQRPKVEEYGDYTFIVAKMIMYNDSERSFFVENLSIVLGPKFVLTFQEQEGDFFDIVRQRIRQPNSRFRNNGPDYLVYRLLDTIVDQYFLVLEKYGDRIEELEVEVTENPTASTLEEIHKLKRELLLLRRPIWPLREAINRLQKEDTALVTQTTHLFLRDVYDHTIQVSDNIDNFREIVSGLLDIYLSSISNKMNEVMKVLTIIATIFIPLTFIAGIYGMNFKFMPELEWRWAYPVVWAIIIAVGVAMLIFFKRKKWL
ncbi:magnesium/cobalt transporter CorA [bacterium]|nr:magnesium/cobalt transporter CorA [bacterium]